MKNIIAALALLAPIAFASCKKEDKDHHMTASGTITVSSPQEQQSFAAGSIINITAKLSANVHLHGYKLSLVTVEGDTVLSKEEHVHSNEILINEQWTDTLSAPADLKLTITSALNHEGNNLERSVLFKTL
jgi:hypothetical protein